jgi:hypothetical protein
VLNTDNPLGVHGKLLTGIAQLLTVSNESATCSRINAPALMHVRLPPQAAGIRR